VQLTLIRQKAFQRQQNAKMVKQLVT
jgi:hypothetical protein